MKKLESIKGKVSDEFYEDIVDLLDIYTHIKFDYLRIKQSSWEDLFVSKAEIVAGKNINPRLFSGELCRLVNLTVEQYIRAGLKNGEIRVCQNLLVKIRSQFKTELVLRNFVYEFEQLGISFMDEVYDLLKEKSEMFRSLLEQFKLQNASKGEFIDFLNQKYKMGIKIVEGEEEKKSPEQKVLSGAPKKKIARVKQPINVGKASESKAMSSDSEEKKSTDIPTLPIVKKKEIFKNNIESRSVGKESENIATNDSEVQTLKEDILTNNSGKKKPEEREIISDNQMKSPKDNKLAGKTIKNNSKDEMLASIIRNQNSKESILGSNIEKQNPEYMILMDDEDNYSKRDIANIDNELMERYSHFTFSEIRNLYGDNFENLDRQDVQLLERFFSVISGDYCFSPYEAEKEMNLLLYGYKRKNIEVDPSILRQCYLENKDKFKPEEALYLECFVFQLQEQSVFSSKFPEGTNIVKSQLISELEMMYYGIEDIFDASLTKEQYISVLEKYPTEIEDTIKDMLDDYYGVHQEALSIQAISEKYDMSYDEAKDLIRKSRKLCLSLYSNLSNSQKADSSIYMPYVLDRRYSLNEDVRSALEQYFAGVSYEEMDSKRGKKGSSSLVSVGLQKIDAYRFGVEKLKVSSSDSDVELVDEDIFLEIERHPSESVISEDEKTFLSFYLGLKNKYNPDQEKLSGAKLQERLNFKRNVPARYRDVLDKIKQRKLGILEPEFIIIPRDKLSEILVDPHLPITAEDRIIIGSLLEINGYSLKSLSALADELGVTIASIRRKYQIAIINISKYLVGEKEGIIDYNVDIVPNLRYFTSKERILIDEYFIHHLTNKEISKKYNLPIGKVTRLMYRIKTFLNECIHNPEGIKFDYEYYQSVVDSPKFPFRGDIEQAKKIFALYVGEENFGRMDIQEIKSTLNLDMQPITISRVIDSLVLSTFKYRDGIEKENSFTVADVCDYYQSKRNCLTEQELQLIDRFLNKGFGIDMRMNEDLTYLLLKEKHPGHFKVDAPKSISLRLLRKYYSQLSKKIRDLLMAYTGVRERDLMSDDEKYQVFLSLSALDLILKEGSNQK